MSQAQITNISDTSRRLALSVSAAELRNAFTKRLQSMQKRAKVNGFRPGKVPLAVVKNLYGGDVLAQVADSLANDKLRQAIQEHGLEPINLGQVDNLPESPEQEWNFAVTFDVVPPFRLPQPETIEASLLRAQVSETDVANTLEQIRRDHPIYIEQDRALGEGDILRLDFAYQVTERDQPVPELTVAAIKPTEFSASHTDQRWQVKREMQVAGLCDAIVGLQKGESKTISLPLDDAYPTPAWRGKQMHVLVQALAVETEQLPELNADFAQKLGIQNVDDHLAELQSRTRKDLENRLESKLLSVNKKRLFKALADATPVGLPQSVIDQHNVQMRRQFVSRFLSPEELQRDPHPENRFKPELFADQAKIQAKVSEVFSRLVREYKLQVDEEQIKQTLARAASEYDDPQEFIRLASKDRGQMREFAMIALEEAVYNWLTERCAVNWQDVSMDEAFASESGERQDQETAEAPEHDPNCDHDH